MPTNNTIFSLLGAMAMFVHETIRIMKYLIWTCDLHCWLMSKSDNFKHLFSATIVFGTSYQWM